MKQYNQFILSVLACTLLLVSGCRSLPSDHTDSSGFKEVQLEVLKVFSANDGNYHFRSYLVEWKGQEVVVEDSLVYTNYQVGDQADVLVMYHDHPDENQETGCLGFTVLPPCKEGSLSSDDTFSPNSERVQLEVLKVFSANDGNYQFRSYLVEWKGQEVVVDDILLYFDYQVSDQACVLVMYTDHPNENQETELLSFALVRHCKKRE